MASPDAGSAKAPYSYSRMIDVINASSRESGVAVEVKKQCPDGSYAPVDDADLKTADFDMQMSRVVNMVKDMPRERRLSFGEEMRRAGNEAYAAGRHGDAVQMYAQAMAGLDQSGDEAMKAAARVRVALPILTNMAASFLALGRPRQALACCDEALQVDDACVKAHLRRGKALLALDRYAESRASFDAARRHAASPAEMRDAEVHRREAAAVAARVRDAERAQRRRLAGAFASGAGLGDTRSAARRRRSDADVDAVLAECFADGAGAAASARGEAAADGPGAAAPTADWSDTLVLAWMAFCVLVVATYSLYGRSLAAYLTRTYLMHEDPYGIDEEDEEALADWHRAGDL